jgi:hypothetical protein
VSCDELLVAEEELERLAGRLDTAVPDGAYPAAALALGHRARTLFSGFRQLIDGPTPIAASSLMRPMVEINLLLRFFGQCPDLHAKLWIAEEPTSGSKMPSCRTTVGGSVPRRGDQEPVARCGV